MRFRIWGPMAVFATRSVFAQTAEPQGVPEDWTHRHVVFSAPASVADYSTLSRDPRYSIQWIHRIAHPVVAAPETAQRAFTDTVEMGRPAYPNEGRRDKAALKNDWAVNMGTGTHGTAAVYPAKYGFLTSTASCSDYVVFPTSVAGSATVPSVIALNNLYTNTSGACQTANPTTFWQAAFLNGANFGSVTTSPVLSLNGTQVAFVTSINSVAYLVVTLAPTGNTSTNTQITCPSATNVNSVAATGSVQAWCAAFSGTSKNDTISSPFYDYTNNVLYVGDSTGVLHKFQNVFHYYQTTGGGTTTTTAPNEVTTTWPVTVNNGHALASPVYDANSGLVFVGDANGQFSSLTASGSTKVTTTNRFSHGTGIVDAPIVDSTTERVYMFAGDDQSASGCSSSTLCSTVFQFETAFTATVAVSTSGTCTISTTVACGAKVGTGSSSVSMYAGTFDNTYYTGAGNTGNLYVCGNTGGGPTLYQISMSSSFGGTANGGATTGPALGTASTCSPISEVYNTSSGTHDWIFMSVTTGGTIGFTGSNTCTGACVYSFDANGLTLTTSTKAVDGIASTGGASGIVIDNAVSSATGVSGGTSQMYYEQLGGTSAVQAAQSSL
jgi:hypothetical protein